MDFWKNAADSVTKAVDFVVDKNRKAAMMNRLKIVIRSEKEAQSHAYAQLGKYYYQNMRDPENGDTEPFCQAIDTSGARLKRAYAKLDELAVPTAAHEPEEYDGGDEDDGMEDVGFDAAPPEAGDFHPDEDYRPDAEHQEAADEDEDYLHPFSVIPNAAPQEDPCEGKEEAQPESPEDGPKE